MTKLVKYGTVTLANYFILIFGIYLLVDTLNISPNISYFFIISFIYIATYFAYTKFVFLAETNKKTITKFIVALIIFWLLNNIFFNIMIEIFLIPYLVAVIVNIIFLGVIRFFTYRNLVFKEIK